MKRKSSNKTASKEIIEKLKNNFITVASHQLRTPISVIRWSLDTLLDGRAGILTSSQVDLIKQAYQNNQSLAKIVDDLLRVSDIEDDGIKLSIQPVDLEAITREIIAKTEIFAKAYNCKISFSAPKDLPKVYTDQEQIKPVIEGLIDNAIRYGKDKGTVSVSLKKSNNFVILEVKDNGIGIAKQDQPLAFSKFFRGKNAIKAQANGMGLTLYISKKVVEASGGKMAFVSKENVGSTFSVSLPTNFSKRAAPKVFLNETEDENLLKKEQEFVSITVHELKAPLGAAKWSLEMLKGGKIGQLSNEQKELVEQIYRGNERLLVLVRDLLDLSKLQEGRFDVNPKLIDLDVVISDAIAGFKLEAEKKKIKLVAPADKNLPKVFGDPNRLAQVVTNLVSNAIKYTPEGGFVYLAVNQMSAERIKDLNRQLKTAEILNTANKKGYLVVAVKDTGIGISEDDQKKLFTRFFRSKNVIQSKEGTGLGLYITKTIVNLHKGDIWFTSKVGGGSTFYFSLPIA